jgi:hypothetical protein
MKAPLLRVHYSGPFKAFLRLDFDSAWGGLYFGGYGMPLKYADV